MEHKICKNPKGRNKLCNNNCDACFELSFASHPKAQFWSKKNTLEPREFKKSSKKKCWFNCDECKHEFESMLQNITLKNTWCPYCKGGKLCDDDDCKTCYKLSFASHHRSEFWDYKLNKDVNPRTIRKSTKNKFWFICDNCPHHFQKQLTHITQMDSWCPYCCQNGGGILCDYYKNGKECDFCHKNSFESHWSSKYISENNKSSPRNYRKTSNSYYNFKCNTCDKEFKTKISNVVSRHSWCPYCCKGKSENLCRNIIEKLTGEKFTTCRPTFLNGLEYDGYNKKLKIAFEYQGVQHYEYHPMFFHKNGFHKFLEQQLRDEIKKRISSQHNINLIIIPYYTENINNFIEKSFKKINYINVNE